MKKIGDSLVIIPNDNIKVEIKTKKTVPFLIPIEFEMTPSFSDSILLWRYERIIRKRYSFPYHDFNMYCSILIRKMGKQSLPQILIDYIYKDETMNEDVRFQLIKSKIEEEKDVGENDFKFFYEKRINKGIERKSIIFKQITTINLKQRDLRNINHLNNSYYNRLLELSGGFDDTTLIDWFIPIVLTYERYIHILVKHVEETKFGDGLFKKRTFFDYRDSEIWKLLKMIINIEKENIEDHFVEVSFNRKSNREHLNKDYRRTQNYPILFNEDKFTLTINKDGFITQFFQLKDY